MSGPIGIQEWPSTISGNFPGSSHRRSRGPVPSPTTACFVSVSDAIEAELAERGFQSTEEPGDANFLVTYSVILEDRLKVNGYSASVGGGYRSHYGGFGSIHSTTSIRNYQESTLIIDFLDPGNDDLVWRGWATGIVRTRDRNWRRDRLEKGVKAILDAFPPGEK